MLEALPSIFPNFQGYFLLGEAHDFFQRYMGTSKHPVLNTERVVHPSSIECKWWDTDHQKVAVRQTCRALFVATGLDFCLSNIENFDDVMPVLAGMKRKSEERLDAAIRREEEEMERLLDAAIRREDRAIAAAASAGERLLDAAIRREDRAIAAAALAAAIRREDRAIAAASAAAMRTKTAKEERQRLDAAIAAASASVKAAKEERLNAAVRRLEEEEVARRSSTD